MKKIITAGIAALLMLPCPAFSADSMDKTAFKQMLKEVLEENPEILFDVMKKNDAAFIESITTASETARTHELSTQWAKDVMKPKSFTADKRPMLGNKNAPNTLYIFSDFLCTYCQKAAGTVESFTKQHKDVNLVFKAFPKNEDGKLAVRWFYYLNQKDSKKAWQLHDTLFFHQQAFATSPLAVLKEIVRQQGFDPEQVVQDIEKNKAELDAMIEQDIEEAKKYHVEGTPYMFLNNIVLVGNQDLTTLESALKYTSK